MKAIILAAGASNIQKGRTLIPTCLMNIGKETILERQIKILRKNNIGEIIVIIGSQGDCWTKENQEKIRKISKNVLVNHFNASTPSASSLLLGLKFFGPSPCLILDGDLVFEERMIYELIKNKFKRVILTEKVLNHEKGTFIHSKNNNVQEIGRQVKSHERFTGLIKIDKKLYKILINELQNSKNYDLEYPVIISKNLKKTPVKMFNIEEIDGEVGDIINSKPLSGGSFASTRVITKLIKKPVYVVRKEAKQGREKLIDEITWIKNLPADLKIYFPEILDCKINKNKAWYEMIYCPNPTLRALIMSKTRKKEEILPILNSLINFMFSKIYSQRRIKSPPDYAKRIHLERIKERLNETKKQSLIMRKIIDSRTITINGKVLSNIPEIIEFLEKDLNLLKRLEPPFLCMTHGDLHFDNLAVDTTSQPIKFTLLDPRGKDKEYNYDYDLGKLWHSFHGKYDLTHEGLFKIKHSFIGDNFIADISFTDNDLFLTYDYLYKEFRKLLYRNNFLKENKNWELRTEFSEMSHFCSVMPFHLKNDNKEEIAIALYLMGVKLANEFVSKYCKNFKPKKYYSYVNINSIKDYTLARKVFGEK